MPIRISKTYLRNQSVKRLLRYLHRKANCDFKMTLALLLLRNLTKAPIYLKIDAFIPMNFHLLTFQICSKLLHTLSAI